MCRADPLKVRLGGGQLGRGVHVDLRVGVSEHGLEIPLAGPVGVVGDSGSVQADVDVGRDETRLVAYDLLGGGPQFEKGQLVERSSQQDRKFAA